MDTVYSSKQCKSSPNVDLFPILKVVMLPELGAIIRIKHGPYAG